MGHRSCIDEDDEDDLLSVLRASCIICKATGLGNEGEEEDDDDDDSIVVAGTGKAADEDDGSGS